MANSRKLIIEVVGDSSKLDKSLKGTESRLQKFGKKQGGFAGVVRGGVGKGGVIGAGVAAGAGVALVGLKKVVEAAKEAQVAQAQLDQAFKASGKSSAKFGKQVDKSIQSISKMAAIDDEEVSASFANLLRSTGSVEKATKGAALAANIARSRNISLATAAKAVEKAYNGSDTALKRVGVVVPKLSVHYDKLKVRVNELSDQLKKAKGPQADAIRAQIEQIKKGYKVAQALDKEANATAALEKAQKQFAGGAEAYGKTAAGAQEKLAVAFENLQEKLGEKLLPLLTKATLKAVEFVEWAEKNWPKFAAAVEDAYRRVKPIIDSQIALYKGIANAVEGMVKIVHGVFTGDWKEAWDGFKQYAIDGIGGVMKAVLMLPAKIGAALTKKAFSGLSKVGTWIKEAIVGGVEGAINRVIDLVNAMIGNLKPVAGLLGKVGIDVKIPQIGHVGGVTSSPGKAPGGSTRRPDEGTRGPQSLSVKLEIDGRDLNSRLTPYRQQSQKRNPGQRRGPNAGFVAG